MDWATIANVTQVVAPTAEPVSVALVKEHLRLSGDPEALEDWEALTLPAYISAARRHAELVTGLNLTDAIYEMRVPGFAYRMVIPAPPVAEIVSITYVDDDGEVQTVDPETYVLESHPYGYRVRQAYEQTWPTPRGADGDEVVIRFRGPYGSAEDSPPRLPVPDDIQVAILLMVGHWHENREEVVATAVNQVPLAAMHILQLNRLSMGV